MRITIFIIVQCALALHTMRAGESSSDAPWHLRPLYAFKDGYNGFSNNQTNNRYETIAFRIGASVDRIFCCSRGKREREYDLFVRTCESLAKTIRDHTLVENETRELNSLLEELLASDAINPCGTDNDVLVREAMIIRDPTIKSICAKITTLESISLKLKAEKELVQKQYLQCYTIIYNEECRWMPKSYRINGDDTQALRKVIKNLKKTHIDHARSLKAQIIAELTGQPVATPQPKKQSRIPEKKAYGKRGMTRRQAITRAKANLLIAMKYVGADNILPEMKCLKEAQKFCMINREAMNPRSRCYPGRACVAEMVYRDLVILENDLKSKRF